MNKILIGVVIFLVLVSAVFLFDNQNTKEDNMEETKYQGPVPEGYDVEHFRATGETIKLKPVGEVNNG